MRLALAVVDLKAVSMHTPILLRSVQLIMNRPRLSDRLVLTLMRTRRSR